MEKKSRLHDEAAWTKNSAHFFERRWLEQLRREFDVLNSRYDLGLRPPVLALHRGMSRLGFWEKGSRRLSLSVDLIEEYGWAAALLVLKHELAHQIADERPGERPSERPSERPGERSGGGARPHDADFLIACHTMDLTAAFCRAVIGEEALAAAKREEGEEHPLVARARKLLALAQSDNIHEAALALAKARQLLARQGMREEELSGEEVVCLPIFITTRRVSGVTRRLFGVISGFFPVSVIETALYDPWQDHEMPMFEIFGRWGAAHFAVHAWHFLDERLASLWRKQRRHGQGNSGRRERDSFMLGVLAGVEESLQKSQAVEEKNPASRALVPADADPAVIARLRRRYPRLRDRRLAGRLVESSNYHQGIEAGRRIEIHEAVGQGQGKLLPMRKRGQP